MAFGSRGTELKGLALLDIAPIYTNTTRGHYVAWYNGTMVCFNAWKNRSRELGFLRYKGTRMV